MNKLLIILFVFFMLVSTNVYAINETIVSYEFEEGVGVIALDNSGNDYHGLLYQGTNYNAISKWGSYSTEYDNGDDYIIGYITEPMPEQIAISLWVYPHNDDTDSPVSIYDEHFFSRMGLSFDANGVKGIFYYDESGIYRFHEFVNNVLLKNQWYHLVLNIDLNQSIARFYIDNTFISEVNLSSPMVTEYDYRIILGTDFYQGGDLDGYIDSVKMYNFLLQDSQIEQLYLYNNITIVNYGLDDEDPVEDEEIIGLNRVTDILADYNPYENSSISTDEVFYVQTSISANCIFYSDYNAMFEGLWGTSYTWNNDLSIGEHTGSIYCYYEYNGTRYYELIDPFKFNVIMGEPTDITFIVSGTDFDISEKEMYIVTPCIKNLFQAGELTKNTLQLINNDGLHYFQELNNGMATFSVQEGMHEFCLINGQVQYSQNNYTTEYNINKVDGLLNLGNFDVISNVTNSYQVKTETFEIYGIANPKAWGQTWSGIIGGLILLIMGALIVIVGANLNNGKMVIAGALLVASALGVSLISFAGVLI